MSGFEIAGLVLGALPLVISALEHYEGGLGTYRAFVKWGDELQKARRELLNQHTSYEMTLMYILQDVVSDTDLAEMMCDAESDLRRSEDIAMGLTRKLGIAYKPYMLALREMEDVMNTLALHLDIDKAKRETTRNELESIILANRPATLPNHGAPKFHFNRRVKFTMKRREVMRLLERLQGCNARMDTFTEKAEKLEGPTEDVSKVRRNQQSRVAFTVTPPARADTTEDLAKLEVIKDLCSVIHKHQDSSCFGLCLDLQGMLRGIYPGTKQNPSAAGDLITLEELLMSPKCKQWGSLTDEDRYTLAVTIASSFLQLHKMPWLGERWSERDIVFFEMMDNRKHVVDVRRPFVTQTYMKSPQNTSAPTATIYNTTPSTSHDASTNLLSLVRILLSIRFNNRIEELRQSSDTGPNAVRNEARDLQTLKRWVTQEKGNLSWAFKDAVSYCMRCFADPTADLEDPDFRHGVIDNVVAPLLEELTYLRDGPPKA
ncbi:hypothetical protein DL762_008325 [Monosporascus cannonballus]|uniref:DUF7580 domain-containing protein n=1 Tax=Monosporascus cannonballus TaxID=155416 RepID=A0ABY0GZT3_9PEZI|nr:hypothetical protein DL762_008325 [Monosporascus cannonballus]